MRRAAMLLLATAARALDGSPGARLRRLAGGAELRPGARYRVRAVGREPEIYAKDEADAAYAVYARLSDAGLAPYVDVLGPPPTAENAPTRELEVLRSLPLAGLILDDDRLDFRVEFLAVANAVLIVGAIAAVQALRPESAAAAAVTSSARAPAALVSHHSTGSSAADRTAAYARSAELFVGGYTVAGTKLSIRPGKAPGATVSFSVAQECICSATATEHGIFTSGANPGNAFTLIATLSESSDEWTAEQTSVGAAPPYKATMRFGATAGGAHTAVGSTLTPSGTVDAFSAEQSAIGCAEGEGAATCEAVCGKYALPWDMIRQKCRL